MKNADQALIDMYGFGYTSCIVGEYYPEGLTCIK